MPLQTVENNNAMPSRNYSRQKKKKKKRTRERQREKKKIIKQRIPWGIEPGPPDWKSWFLTTKPQGLSTSGLNYNTLFICILSWYNCETFRRFTVTNHLNLSLSQYIKLSNQWICNVLIRFIPMDHVSAKTNHNIAIFQRFTLSKWK